MRFTPQTYHLQLIKLSNHVIISHYKLATRNGHKTDQRLGWKRVYCFQVSLSGSEWQALSLVRLPWFYVGSIRGAKVPLRPLLDYILYDYIKYLEPIKRNWMVARRFNDLSYEFSSLFLRERYDCINRLAPRRICGWRQGQNIVLK